MTHTRVTIENDTQVLWRRGRGTINALIGLGKPISENPAVYASHSLEITLGPGSRRDLRWVIRAPLLHSTDTMLALIAEAYHAKASVEWTLRYDRLPDVPADIDIRALQMLHDTRMTITRIAVPLLDPLFEQRPLGPSWDHVAPAVA